MSAFGGKADIVRMATKIHAYGGVVEERTYRGVGHLTLIGFACSASSGASAARSHAIRAEEIMRPIKSAVVGHGEPATARSGGVEWVRVRSNACEWPMKTTPRHRLRATVKAKRSRRVRIPLHCKLGPRWIASTSKQLPLTALAVAAIAKWSSSHKPVSVSDNN